MNRFGTPLVKLPGEAVWSVSIPLSSPLGLNAMSGSDLQKSISTRLSVWRGVSSHVVKARADWDLTWKKRYASRSCRFNIEINDKTQQETNFLLLISAVIELKYIPVWMGSGCCARMRWHSTRRSSRSPEEIREGRKYERRHRVKSWWTSGTQSPLST